MLAPTHISIRHRRTVLISLFFTLIFTFIHFTVSAQSATEQVWLEAESGSIGNDWLTVNSDSAYGGAYIVVKGNKNSTSGAPTINGQVTYNFSVTEGGDYTLWGRFLVPSVADDSIWIQVDGGTWYEWNYIHDALGNSYYWGWDDLQTGSNTNQAMTFNFAPNSSHTLKIGYREDDTKLDRFLFVNEANYIPSDTLDDQAFELGRKESGESANDAEQDGSIVNINSTSIYLSNPSGFRFSNVTIPADAIITHAYLEVVAFANYTAPNARYVISAENTGNAPPFNTNSNNITNRLHTNNSVVWDMPSFSKYTRYKSANLSSIIQEIIDRGDWQSGNALALLVHDGGLGSTAIRRVISWDTGTGAKAPILHIEYTTSGGSPTLTPIPQNTSIPTNTPPPAPTNTPPPAATNTPVPTDPPATHTTTPSGGDMWFEAESGNLGNKWLIQNVVDACSGQYITIQPGTNDGNSPSSQDSKRATYTFSVDQAGDYKIWGRVIAPDNQSDSFWIRVDTGPWNQWNNIPLGNSWHWDDVHETTNNDTAVIYSLSAGTHTITLANREDGTDIDKFLVTNDLSATPSGCGSSNPSPTNTPPPGATSTPTPISTATNTPMPTPTNTPPPTATPPPNTNGIQLTHGKLTNVGSDWQTVTLDKSYNSMVVVALPLYGDANTSPAVARIRNASGNSFEIKVQNPSDTALSGYAVHYIVVEEGIYTVANDGVKIEAVKFTSTNTSNKSDWNAVSTRSYANSYNAPVVLGQVMSANDAAWSAFFAYGSSRTNPPSNSTLKVGKSVGEDSNKTRQNETIGYIVIEAGSGTLDGVNYEANVGADTVSGVGNNPPYTYNINLAGANIVLASLAGVDGADGGWPVLFGANTPTDTTVDFAVDEDQIADSERAHTNEQLAYLILATGGSSTTPTPIPTATSTPPPGATSTPTPMPTPTSPPPTATPPPNANGIQLTHGKLTGVGSNWLTVFLDKAYNSMVVVALPVYENASTTPAIVRIRNASGNSFEIKVQNPSNMALSGYTVHYMVVEEGVYTVANDGVKMEAVKFTSTNTANKSDWNAVSTRSYANSYTTPVVVGQVMSANDTAWSGFFAYGSSRTNPPNSSNLNVGKHVGEDTNKTRQNETIGYIVIEAGSGTLDGVNYEANVGADTVSGVGNNPPYTYNINLAGANIVLASLAGVDGGEGGWPVLFGVNTPSNAAVNFAVDEDQIGDSERSHSSEQLTYLILTEGMTDVPPPSPYSGMAVAPANIINNRSGVDDHVLRHSLADDTFGSSVGDPISLSDLSWYKTIPTLQLGGNGIPIMVSLTYNTRNWDDGLSSEHISLGWNVSYERRLAIRSNRVDLQLPTGDIYVWDESGNDYIARTGNLAELSQAGSEYTITYRDGYKEIYDSEGELIRLEDAVGNQVTIEWIEIDAYTARRIITNQVTGQALWLVYKNVVDPNRRWRLAEIRDASGNGSDIRSVKLTYNGDGQLYHIEDEANHIHEFAHDAEGRIYRYYDPVDANNWLMENSYQGNTYKVSTHRLRNGNQIDFSVVGNELTVTYRGASGATRSVTYLYDEAGTLVTGRLASQTFPNSSVVASSVANFNNNWQAEGIDTASGQTIDLTYDANGNVIQYQRVNGANTLAPVQLNNYNSLGQPGQLVDSEGYTTDYTYLSNGLVDTVTTQAKGVAGSQLTDFNYNAYGQVTQAILPDNIQNQITYDALGYPQRTTYASGSSVSLRVETTYSWQGWLTEGTDLQQAKTEYSYYDNGWLKEEKLRSKKDTTHYIYTRYEYDEVGNLTKLIEDAEGLRAITTYEYEAIGMTGEYAVVEMTDAEGAITRYEYNDFGQLTKVIQVNAINGTSDHVTRYTYTTQGWLDQVFVNNQLVINYDYYNNSGLLRQTTDARNVRTRYTYDPFDRIATMIVGDTSANDGCTGNDCNAIDATYTYYYDDNDQLTRIDGPNNWYVTYSYDAYNRVSEVDVAGEKITQYEYDGSRNWLTQETVGTGSDAIATAYAYDALGRRTQMTVDPNGENLTTQYFYDTTNCSTGQSNEWFLQRVVDPNGQTTLYCYDYRALLVRRVNDVGARWFYYYNDLGFMTRMRTATDVYTDYARDLMGRMLSLTEDTRVEEWTYHPGGALESYTDFAGGTTNYTYDTLGRLQTVDYPSPTSGNYAEGTVEASTVTYDYYNNGLLTSATAGGKAITYEYDSRNLRLNRNYDNRSLSYTYNDNGWLTGIGYDWLGESVSYDYNGAGQLATLTPWGSSSIHYDYQNNGLLGNINRPNQAPDTSFGYDGAGRLLDINHGAGLAIQYRTASNAPALDNNGNILGRNDSFGQHVYNYDTLDRLTQVELPAVANGPDAGTIDYNYDSLSNRTEAKQPNVITQTAFFLKHNLLQGLSDDNRDYYPEHDANGNLISLMQTIVSSTVKNPPDAPFNNFPPPSDNNRKPAPQLWTMIYTPFSSLLCGSSGTEVLERGFGYVLTNDGRILIYGSKGYVSEAGYWHSTGQDGNTYNYTLIFQGPDYSDIYRGFGTYDSNNKLKGVYANTFNSNTIIASRLYPDGTEEERTNVGRFCFEKHSSNRDFVPTPPPLGVLPREGGNGINPFRHETFYQSGRFFTYDTANRLIATETITDSLDSNGDPLVETTTLVDYQYDPLGNLIYERVDYKGVVTTTTIVQNDRSTLSRVIAEIRQVGNEQTTHLYAYGPTGLAAVKVTDPVIVQTPAQSLLATVSDTAPQMALPLLALLGLSWLRRRRVSKQGHWLSWVVVLGLFGSVLLGAVPITKAAPGVLYHAFNDHQGSLMALTQEDGTVALQKSYDAYGNIRHQVGQGNLSSIGYTGERAGTGDGLLWLRARHYDPEMGRFVQRDSIDPGGSHNRYAYVEGNPINATDPTGHRPNRRARPEPANSFGEAVGIGDTTPINCNNTGELSTYRGQRVFCRVLDMASGAGDNIRGRLIVVGLDRPPSERQAFIETGGMGTGTLGTGGRGNVSRLDFQDSLTNSADSLTPNANVLLNEYKWLLGRGYRSSNVIIRGHSNGAWDVVSLARYLSRHGRSLGTPTYIGIAVPRDALTQVANFGGTINGHLHLIVGSNDLVSTVGAGGTSSGSTQSRSSGGFAHTVNRIAGQAGQNISIRSLSTQAWVNDGIAENGHDAWGYCLEASLSPQSSHDRLGCFYDYGWWR